MAVSIPKSLDRQVGHRSLALDLEMGGETRGQTGRSLVFLSWLDAPAKPGVGLSGELYRATEIRGRRDVPHFFHLA